MEYTAQHQGISLTAETRWLGHDLCVMVTGGQGHIGSVSMASPRPSLSDPAQSSATVSTFNYIAHKDDTVGNRFAHTLSAQLGRHVVVLCGIHYDGLAPEQLTAVTDLAQVLLAQVLQGECPEEK